MADIAKINGIQIGNVAKINGIDIANIGNINGVSPTSFPSVTATVDNNLIDSGLTNFPVGVEIDASHGILYNLTSTDWQYIHATVGGVECYVEVDVWDMDAEKAVLWIRVPTVSSSVDTDIKIAITATANLSYVGKTGDVAAQNVWDSNYVGVWHMSQDPSASNLLDSTSYGNNGTPNGSMTSDDLIDGGFGKAIEFDGTDDYFVVADSDELDLTAAKSMTMESFANSYSTGGQHDMLDKRITNQGYLLGVNSSDLIDYYAKDDSDPIYITATTTVTRDGTTFYHFAGKVDRSAVTMHGYLNGVEDATPVSTSVLDDCSNSIPLYIGYRNPGLSSSWTYFYGAISEARISDIVRSAAWIKATAQNLLGNLVAIS